MRYSQPRQSVFRSRAIAVSSAISTALTVGVTLDRPSVAQIEPDSTLPSPSVVNAQDNRTAITGGTQVGQNLFHSFREFSVPAGASAVFQQDLAIQNIFSRVTGSSASNIEGLIQASGTANLFLLNPNGILFGPDARLDIGGSFFASTADRLVFDNADFSATNPQAPPLLAINVRPGLQLGAEVQGGTITTQGVLSAPQNLSLQAAQLRLEGQLQSGGDLYLQATNTLQIRDSFSQPFIAQAGGKIEAQSSLLIDIFALNQPESALTAQGDLTLRSPDPIYAEARLNSGGNVRVETFGESLGTVSSPSGTVIRALGDVSFYEYRGASLQILAGGSVYIPNGLRISGAGIANPLSTVALSDGTRFALDGQSEATLDIRAGIRPSALNLATTAGVPPTRAEIQLGKVNFTELSWFSSLGRLLLTTQFEPNLALASGDISLIDSVGGTEAGNGGGGINAVAIYTNGVQTAIDSRGNLNAPHTLTNFSVFKRAGDIKLLAQGDISSTYISANSYYGAGGNVSIWAGGDLSIAGSITTSAQNNAGNIQLTARGNITVGVDPNESDKNNISGSIDAFSRDGTAGLITLNAGQTVVLDHMNVISSAILSGNSGAIEIETGDSIVLEGTVLTSSTGIEQLAVNNFFTLGFFGLEGGTYSGNGNAGHIRLQAGQNITGTASAVYSTIVEGGQGNAGNIAVAAGNTVTWQGGTGRFIYPGFYAFSRGNGNAGNITIEARAFNLLGSLVETGLSSQSIGQSGDITITVHDRMRVDGNGWLALIANGVRPGGKVAESLGSGNIHIRAGTLTLQNGVGITTGIGDVNQGYVAGGRAIGNAGNIELRVSGDLSLSQSFISSQVFTNGRGNAGQIGIQAGSIALDRSVITSETAGRGDANSIWLNADQITLNNSDISSAVQLTAIGHGRGVTLDARTIALTNGGQINTVSSGDGAAGNVQLTAETVQIGGGNATRTPINFFYAWEPNARGEIILPPWIAGGYVNTPRPVEDILYAWVPNSQPFLGAFPFTTAPDFVDGLISGIFSNTNTSSRGGNITVNARSLTVRDGGAIDARTTAIGNGGTISITGDQLSLQSGGQINAVTTGSGDGGTILLKTDHVQITGSDPTYATRLAQFGTQTDIYGKARVGNPSAASGIFASSQSSGDGGTIDLRARTVGLSQGGEISVTSQGTGDGGQIDITSGNLTLDRANIVAKTESGEGGNISLSIQRLLTLRHNSQISATANGTGNGGNIKITSDGFILAIPRENSDITANAVRGRGGNIQITTQAMFGISPYAPPEWSNITASSQFGLDGTVQLTTLQPEPDQDAQEVPQLVDAAHQIVQTCSPQSRANTFTVTGKGGLSPDPTEALSATSVWTASETRADAGTADTPIVEATHWVENSDGSVTLLADRRVLSRMPTCSGEGDSGRVDSGRVDSGRGQR
jgi:filamentous hemagglutinin family protein